MTAEHMDDGGGVSGAVGGVRRLSAIAGAVVLLEAGVLSLLVGAAHPVLLPVTADFGVASSRVQVMLAPVDLGVAVVILCAIVGVCRLAVAAPGLFPRYARALLANRHGIRWLEVSFTAAITVFLIAQLNVVRDVAALVPIYAITSGAVLLGAVQERSVVRDGHPMLPLCLQAAIEIVPWGVIAFTQVGADVTGVPLSGIARIITLALLAAALLRFVVVWREQRAAARGTPALAGERSLILLSVIATSAFAWLMVVGVVLPA